MKTSHRTPIKRERISSALLPPMKQQKAMDESSPKVPMPNNPSVKPALKHPTKAAAASSMDTDDKKEKHLTWDEHAIEEHDVLRGTRMKIDEPNTPFTHYQSDEDEQSTSSGRHPRSPDEKNHHAPPLQWNALESKLQVVADKQCDTVACTLSPAPSRDGGASDSEGEAEIKRRRAKQEEHDKAFKDHRKKHYNEAEAMRRWRAEHMDDDSEDDDGGDDDEKMNGTK